DPCCPPNLDFMQCWNEIAKFKEIIRQVIGEIGGPIKTGPIQGVTDGSEAKPGEVGEYLQTTTTITYPAATSSVQNISAAIIPPGDWDLYSMVETIGSVNSIDYTLLPQPVGVSTSMGGGMTLAGATTNFWLPGFAARGLFAVPTLLPFVVRINYFGTPG